MKRLAVTLLGLALALPLLASAQNAPEPLQWAGTWAAAPMRIPPSGVSMNSVFENTTFRQIVHLSTGGPYVRVRLSNVFGAGPMQVTSIHVADAVSA
ncbi:MAG: SGNH/GDSL hydrolase family protein, partial [Acidobacteriaceae bacterium]